MEPTEIREEVKEEFEREEKQRERWINYLAVTTVLLAVCATLSSFKLEHFSVESVLNQVMASDQWAFYQAKGTKGYLYELQKEQLELELKTIEKNASADLIQEYRQKIESYGRQAKRYNKEKEDIMKEAKHLEKERDEAHERRELFGKSIIFLQMGILVCSIAALMKRKSIWVAGSLVGLLGIAYFAYGFLSLT
jgi:cation transport ATPase